MIVRLRNVDTSLDDPVETWPFEAVLTVLERGGLREWRSVALVVRRDPWGPLTRKVEQALEVAQPYGVTPLFREIIESSRSAQEADFVGQVAQRVRTAVTESGLTAADFAIRIGTSPSRLSTYMTGRVTPSAALLLRIEDTAKRVRTGHSEASGHSSGRI